MSEGDREHQPWRTAHLDRAQVPQQRRPSKTSPVASREDVPLMDPSEARSGLRAKMRQLMQTRIF